MAFPPMPMQMQGHQAKNVVQALTYRPHRAKDYKVH